MLRKSNILCCGGLQLLNALPSPPSSHPTTTGGIRPPCSSTSQSPCCHYATTQSDFYDDFSWPAITPFTPYDIFKQNRNAPYSKNRFYDLVKIYHPDRPCNGHPLCKDLSPEVRVHRYRLLVAAHEILSDPAKRAAYDHFGAGWNYRTGATHEAPTSSWARAGMSSYHGPVYSNATWEDWERYYNRYHGKQQNAVDHRTFTSMVILIALFGGAVQLSMIGQYNTGYEQRIREVNEQSARFLTGRRQDSVEEKRSAEARVKQFLMHRDPTGFGLKEGEQEVYKDVLHNESASATEGAKEAVDKADETTERS